MIEKEEEVTRTCPRCGKKNTVFRVDGSLFCRACGHDTQKEVKKDDE